MYKSLVYYPKYPKKFFGEFIKRYERVLELLEKTGLKAAINVVEPFPMGLFDFAFLHDESYLKGLYEASERDETLREALEIDCAGASGTVLACKLALSENIAFHLGGGFHHAFRGNAGDYDYINDIAVAIKKLKLSHNLSRIIVIDLDVHHANGTEAIFLDDPTVLQISFHGEGIFPGSGRVNEIGIGRGKGYKVNLPFLSKTSDSTYLLAIDEIIEPLFESYAPQLAIYQAGVDSHHADSLGNLSLSLNGLYERDAKIKKIAERCPIAVIRGGGYNDEYSPKANTNTIAAFLERGIIFSHSKKITEPKRNRRVMEKRIGELKTILSKYWRCFN
jgi:acetoin utilization protein AcuC